jgi:hypothetical protein
MNGNAADQPPTSEDRRMLNEYLADRDTPCPRCGYNLRGLTGGRCPECGDELRLQVGLVEPRLGAYITLLAGCCLGLGGSALMGLIALTVAPSAWWTEPSALLLLGQFVLCAILVPITLAARRRFRTAPPVWQWLQVGAVWLLVLTLSSLIVVLFDG